MYHGGLSVHIPSLPYKAGLLHSHPLYINVLRRHLQARVAIACADAPMPKLGPISALRHRRTLSSELAMTPRRAPESPMGNTSPSMGSPAAENRPKPWPGVILYGVFASLVTDCLTISTNDWSASLQCNFVRHCLF